ncbi:hydroxyisourate hydrolase [Sphingomonas sp. AP4-R1]|uniref:hydroxyisourate hydrolase n=1 Tax=Sphingomonas sp. AP4-R1 TaxID=2735134 RepID=UPI0014935A6B|nr:hydroxyisourate hydrolase [Sphingomonas sp. AP4-R1]QJU56812.1 hydroxyisourate hydrolase [Sphingomonas sp. AP4-R1]
MSLSTHVLDTTHGRPAAGVAFFLVLADEIIFRGYTDADGRCPDLKGMSFQRGRYTLSFAVADYFRGLGLDLPDPPFLDRVRIDFGISDEAAHYHVPLLVSPYSYSTYRGS